MIEDKDLDALFKLIPSILASAMGWLGYQLSKAQPGLSLRQWVGGVILSGFTGAMTFALLSHIGWDYWTASFISSAIGSSGLRGYEWIVDKLFSLIDKKGDKP